MKNKMMKMIKILIYNKNIKLLILIMKIIHYLLILIKNNLILMIKILINYNGV